MKFNPFAGARRIAVLLAGAATAITLVVLAVDAPYVSATYSVSHPNGPFVKSEDSCPSSAGQHYFSSDTSSGKSVSITLCLLPIEFEGKKEMLIPYRVDEKGMIWGASRFSSEVSAYERRLESRFSIPPRDEDALEKEISSRYWKSWREGIQYLVIGLALFGAFVWATGWVVRGFLGIPQGADKRPDTSSDA